MTIHNSSNMTFLRWLLRIIICAGHLWPLGEGWVLLLVLRGELPSTHNPISVLSGQRLPEIESKLLAGVTAVHNVPSSPHPAAATLSLWHCFVPV